VGRECTQTLLQALLISNVRLHAVKYRHQRALIGRDKQARLSHQRQQACRLERDRLAAGIRTGDQQQVEIITQIETDRDDLAAQERMPSIEQSEDWLACRSG